MSAVPKRPINLISHSLSHHSNLKLMHHMKMDEWHWLFSLQIDRMVQNMRNSCCLFYLKKVKFLHVFVFVLYFHMFCNVLWAFISEEMCLRYTMMVWHGKSFRISCPLLWELGDSPHKCMVVKNFDSFLVVSLSTNSWLVCEMRHLNVQINGLVR